MKKGLTEIVFILDRSGSMRGLETDTVGGFNSMIAKQKKEEGDALVSTVIFDHVSEVIHDRVPLNEVPEMTENDYSVRGSTALIDAIGDAVKHVSHVHKYIRDEDVPERTLFVITTDGMENSSRKYSADQVREMIRKQTEKKGWEFIFLGSNIDAVKTAAGLGISEDRAVNYNCDKTGTWISYAAVGEAISQVRACHAMGSKWRAKIDEDYAERVQGKEKEKAVKEVKMPAEDRPARKSFFGKKKV